MCIVQEVLFTFFAVGALLSLLAAVTLQFDLIGHARFWLRLYRARLEWHLRNRRERRLYARPLARVVRLDDYRR